VSELKLENSQIFGSRLEPSKPPIEIVRLIDFNLSIGFMERLFR